MKLKIYILFLIILSAGGLLLINNILTREQNEENLGLGISSNYWKYIGSELQPILDTWPIRANDDLIFYDEIKPDGSTCSDGQILKRTGADNWDCATDATGGDGGYAEFTQVGDNQQNVSTTPFLFAQGLYASTTIMFDNATITGSLYVKATSTLTNLSVTGIADISTLIMGPLSWDDLINKPATSTVLSLLDSDLRISHLNATTTLMDNATTTGNFAILKKFSLSNATTKVLDNAGITVTSSDSIINISSSADLLMTSIPHFTTSTDGTLLIIHNNGNFDIEFQDLNNLSGSGMEIQNADPNLEPNTMMTFIYLDSSNNDKGGWEVQSHPNTSASANILNVRNTSGSTIAAFKPVYRAGYNTGLKRVLIALADGDDADKMPAIGITTASISDNRNGEIITSGTLRNIDTSSFSEGDFLYVDTTAGVLTATRPTVDEVQKMAEVLRSQANNGVVLIQGAGRSNDESWNINVTTATTTELIVGSTVPPNELGVGDLFVGGNATVTNSLTVDKIYIPNSYSDTDFSIYGYTTGAARTQGIYLENTEGYAYLWLSGDVSGGDDAGQIHFRSANDSDAAEITVFQNDMLIEAGGVLKLQGREKIDFLEGSSVKITLDVNQFYPSSNQDLGRAANFWDEIFTDEIILQQGTMGTTAADQTRLAGLDLSAGDAGLHVKTENDTEYLFASKVGFGLTNPTSIFHISDGTNDLFQVTDEGTIGSASTTGFMVIGTGLDATALSAGDLFVSSNATVTNTLSVTTLEVNDDYIIDFTGTNLSVTDGVLSATGGGGEVGGLYGINVETLSADKTLTADTDEIYQFLDTNDVSRTVTLDTVSANTGDRFIIKNDDLFTRSRALTIKQDTTTLDIIYSKSVKNFIFDGTNWQGVENGTRGIDTDNNVAIGYNTRSNNFGTAIGYSVHSSDSGTAIGYIAIGNSSGVAIGHSSDANNSGVAIGQLAVGSDSGVAIGRFSKTNSKKQAVALGIRSSVIRTAEIAHNIDGSGTQDYSKSSAGFAIQTANATPIEAFLGEGNNERFTINPESSVTFTMLVTARDNVADHTAAYKFEGLIKRDSSNNTTLVNLTKTVIFEEDNTWDIDVTADDTNESLKVEVTGDASNPTRWAIRVDTIETQF